MNEDLIYEQLLNLNENEAKNLIEAIKNYLNNENVNSLEKEIVDLFEYFKKLPYKYRDIYLFLFKSAKKENDRLSLILDELILIFQKKYVFNIFTEINNMPIEYQKEFYDNVFLDISTRYEYFIENNKMIKK